MISLRKQLDTLPARLAAVVAYYTFDDVRYTLHRLKEMEHPTKAVQDVLILEDIPNMGRTGRVDYFHVAMNILKREVTASYIAQDGSP